jgi:Uma2 family endonuclease
VYHPRAVVQFQGSEVEPDLMVRQPHPRRKDGWAAWPKPILIVEIGSPSTRRRDREHKRNFYVTDLVIPEYWIVDPERREFVVVRPGVPNVVAKDRVTWRPSGTDATLEIDVQSIFGNDEPS